ncbi:sensor histidine kinase [Kiloniella spongiae]|uniref:sensor histidine kinase n=1 Tax=Kiloniella spongiae TaxID=1489064 RepID=UPI00069C73FA|nr:ATP-binding protein [Kiloniella spongiae]
MGFSEVSNHQGSSNYLQAPLSPLCRKITAWVFASIVTIEIIILFFSYQSQEKKLLAALEHTGHIAVTSAFSSDHHLHGVKDTTDPVEIFGLNDIIGVTVFENHKEVLSAGQRPVIPSEHIKENDVFRHETEETSSYNFGWKVGKGHHGSQIVYIRMNTQAVTKELDAFVLRIFGLVLIISLFVTSMTMFVLWIFVLRPILNLRSMCHAPYSSNCINNLPVRQLERNDEMGDLFRSFKAMTLDIQQAARASRNVQNLLEEQIIQRTAELEQLNQKLSQQVKTTQQSESRFRMYAQSAADWYWEMDADLRFSFLSERFQNVTGVSPELLLGKTRQETGIPDVDPDLWEKHLQCLKEHKPFRNFIYPRAKDTGQTAWLSINGEPVFDDNGVFHGYQGTGVNITERKEAEERTEKASKAKSEFLSSMSHELRTPLNSILGFSQLIDDDETPLNDEQKLCISNITKAGNHLLELINQILDLSKIEAGSVTFNPEHFYPREVFKECLEMFRGKAGERSITMRGIQESDKGILLDRFRFKQIVINFLSNAIKYAPEGSDVVFGCQDLPEDRIYIYVTDSGPGVPESMIPELFTPFERLHHKGSEIEGTGIGLAISKKLAVEMGGIIGYHNKEKNNSTFWLEFPTSSVPSNSEEVSIQHA